MSPALKVWKGQKRLLSPELKQQSEPTKQKGDSVLFQSSEPGEKPLLKFFCGKPLYRAESKEAPSPSGGGLRTGFGAAALFILGLAFFLFGYFRGEAALILQKAVRLCLECVGIG